MKTLPRILTLTLAFCFSLPCFGATDEDSASASPPAVPLTFAALQGDLPSVEAHITAGTDVNAPDSFGSRPLTLAVIFGHRDVARALVEAGADLELTDKEGSTPLHLAAFFARGSIAGDLLARGADKYARSGSGATPYDIVAAPFEDDIAVYRGIQQGLGPLGLKLDLERIRMERPKLAELLRTGDPADDHVSFAPRLEGDWEVSVPESQGLDPLLVSELYADAERVKNIYSVLVVKNGYIVAEQYFHGADPEEKFLIQSATKSITSALIGIAIERGCLSGVEAHMLDFFPELADSISDPRKREITVQQMLQMRAGFPWEESDPALWKALESGSYLGRIETFPLINDPGTAMHYSNLTSHWLGVILARACDQDLRSFAEEHLFSKIGAEVGSWRQDRDGYYIGLGEVHTRARDMARFGLLYLRKGKLDGEQIVAEEWVRDSLKSYSDNVWQTPVIGRYFRDLGYGYQWWSAKIGPRRFNFAWGHGGQLIVLLPEDDVVIVTTADPFWLQHDAEAWRHEQAVLNLVGKFISLLPAPESAG